MIIRSISPSERKSPGKPTEVKRFGGWNALVDSLNIHIGERDPRPVFTGSEVSLKHVCLFFERGETLDLELPAPFLSVLFGATVFSPSPGYNFSFYGRFFDNSQSIIIDERSDSPSLTRGIAFGLVPEECRSLQFNPTAPLTHLRFEYTRHGLYAFKARAHFSTDNPEVPRSIDTFVTIELDSTPIRAVLTSIDPDASSKIITEFKVGT